MSDISNKDPLEVIEVPPELRGPSDEEILKMSEKVLREVKGKRKKGERRPSKRRRMELKAQKVLQEAQDAARELFAPKEYTSENAKKAKPAAPAFFSTGFSTFATSASLPLPPKKSANSSASDINKVGAYTATEANSSGRVLKASFGRKQEDRPKAVIVSAAELAKQRAEERAKKIRETLLAQKLGTSPTEIKNEIAAEPKRPRGRPRKNPL